MNEATDPLIALSQSQSGSIVQSAHQTDERMQLLTLGIVAVLFLIVVFLLLKK